MPPREPTRLNLVTIGRVYQLCTKEPGEARQWYDALIQVSKAEDHTLGQMRVSTVDEVRGRVGVYACVRVRVLPVSLHVGVRLHDMCRAA